MWTNSGILKMLLEGYDVGLADHSWLAQVRTQYLAHFTTLSVSEPGHTFETLPLKIAPIMKRDLAEDSFRDVDISIKTTASLMVFK